MKTIRSFLSLAFALSTLILSAQTKKPAVPVKKASAASNHTAALSSNNTAPYTTALGIQFLYGISVTAKHFIKDNSALEGIFNYRGFGGLGTQLGITALYEYQRPIAGVPNLQWYLGGGGHFEYFSFDDSNVDATSIFGLTGVLGLEYKFENLPIALSADWQPVFTLNEGGGFSAEGGGISIKYTF